MPLAVGTAALSPPRNTGRDGLQPHCEWASHCATETHSRPSSASSVCSPWSAVHVCVLGSLCTAAVPCFSVQRVSISPQVDVTGHCIQPNLGLQFSQRLLQTLLKTSALALSEAINQLQAKKEKVSKWRLTAKSASVWGWRAQQLRKEPKYTTITFSNCLGDTPQY